MSKFMQIVNLRNYPSLIVFSDGFYVTDQITERLKAYRDKRTLFKYLRSKYPDYRFPEVLRYVTVGKIEYRLIKEKYKELK